jgi:hypothetical protein
MKFLKAEGGFASPDRAYNVVKFITKSIKNVERKIIIG